MTFYRAASARLAACALVALALIPLLSCRAFAAPMFPDVPDMWAKDAVAALAAKGLLEGYPDGTFKGDRAATRYEVAMIVARLLAKAEQEHATFATRADLDELRRVVTQLRSELEALGVRVQNLEDNVGKIDRRVTDLERITFYGSLDMRFASMRTSNAGLSQGLNGSATGGLGGTSCAGPLAALLPNTTTVQGAFNPAVGIPILTVAEGVAILQGRPLLVREIPWNTSSYNTLNAGVGGVGVIGGVTQGVGLRPSYNLVVGSTRSLGGDSPAAAVATGGSFLTGLTGRVGQIIAVPAVLPTFGPGGRPWTSGVGNSGTGILGVKIKLDADMDAGAEFAAYYSSGDPTVDAFYGVSAPRLSNAFTGTGGMGFTGQGLDNQPFTRMNLDNFWFLHKPSGIRVQLGSFPEVNMDPIVYTPQLNPNQWGPRYLNDYGFRVSGKARLGAPVEWEAFGSIVADGNRLAPEAQANGGASYQPYLWGADLKWSFGNPLNSGSLRLNALRIWDGPGAGQGAATVGSISNINGVWLDWTNPNGFYAAQINPLGPSDWGNAQKIAGIGSTSDIRPIIPTSATSQGNRRLVPFQDQSVGAFGLVAGVVDPSVLISGNGQGSTFGPQSMFTWGASGSWQRVFNKDFILSAGGEYSQSLYKPSANSSYQAPTGNAMRLSLGSRFLDAFNLGAEYVSVDPFHNPYVLQYPSSTGITQSLWGAWFPEMYPVSDKEEYPNNRQGYRIKFAWAPTNPKTGKPITVFGAKYEDLSQQRTSLQDVRYSPGSIAVGNAADLSTVTPNGFILGNRPGFIDTAFPGFYISSFDGFTGSPTPSSVNQFATPLENPKGHVTSWGLSLSYRFERLHGLGLHWEHLDIHNRRGTVLSPEYGGSENNVDLRQSGGLVALEYPVNPRLSVKVGYAYTHFGGHADPAGVFRNYALDTNSVSFQNYNTDQSMPFVGVDWDVARNVRLNVMAQFLTSHDNLGSFQSRNFYMNRNPFSWGSTSVTSQVHVTF